MPAATGTGTKQQPTTLLIYLRQLFGSIFEFVGDQIAGLPGFFFNLTGIPSLAAARNKLAHSEHPNQPSKTAHWQPALDSNWVWLFELILRAGWFCLVVGLITSSPAATAALASMTIPLYFINISISAYFIGVIGAIFLPSMLTNLREILVDPVMFSLYKKLLRSLDYEAGDVADMARYSVMTMSQQMFLLFNMHVSSLFGWEITSIPIDLKRQVAQEAARKGAGMNAVMTFSMLYLFLTSFFSISTLTALPVSFIVGFAAGYMTNQTSLNKGLGHFAGLTKRELEKLETDANTNNSWANWGLRWIGYITGFNLIHISLFGKNRDEAIGFNRLTYARAGRIVNTLNVLGAMGASIGAVFSVLLPLPAFAAITASPYLTVVLVAPMIWGSLQLGMAVYCLGQTVWCTKNQDLRNTFTYSGIGLLTALLAAAIGFALYPGMPMAGMSLLAASGISLSGLLIHRFTSNPDTHKTINIASTLSFYISFLIIAGYAILNIHGTLGILAALNLPAWAQTAVGIGLIGILGGVIANGTLYFVAVINSFANLDRKPVDRADAIINNALNRGRPIPDVVSTIMQGVLENPRYTQPTEAAARGFWQRVDARAASWSKITALIFNASGNAALFIPGVVLISAVLSNTPFAASVVPLVPWLFPAVGFTASFCICYFSWRNNMLDAKQARAEMRTNIEGLLALETGFTGGNQDRIEDFYRAVLTELLAHEEVDAHSFLTVLDQQDAESRIAEINQHHRGNVSEKLRLVAIIAALRLPQGGKESPAATTAVTANPDTVQAASKCIAELEFNKTKVDPSAFNLTIYGIIKGLTAIVTFIATCLEVSMNAVNHYVAEPGSNGAANDNYSGNTPARLSTDLRSQQRQGSSAPTPLANGQHSVPVLGATDGSSGPEAGLSPSASSVVRV